MQSSRQLIKIVGSSWFTYRETKAGVVINIAKVAIHGSKEKCYILKPPILWDVVDRNLQLGEDSIPLPHDVAHCQRHAIGARNRAPKEDVLEIRSGGIAVEDDRLGAQLHVESQPKVGDAKVDLAQRRVDPKFQNDIG